MGLKIHTHYDNLKVARNAPDFVIRAAYKALSQQYHPDKHGGSPAAANAMRLINEAYAELSDPTRRATHDAWILQQEAQAKTRTEANHQAQTQAPPSPPPQPTKSAATPPSSPPPRTTATSGHSNLWAYGGGLLILLLVLALMNSKETRTKSPPSSAGSMAPSSPNQSPGRYATNSPGTSPPLGSRTADPGAVQPPTFAPTPAPISAINLLPRGRVNAVELNVRAGPGANHDVVARLRFLDTVSIEGPANNGWIPVSHQAGFGYVNGTYIQAGPDTDTLQALCRDEGPAPISGTMFKRPSTAGDHELRINATIDHDAMVKLKDAQGHTVVSGFVRRGEIHSFQGIPSGVYTTWFATGSNFSSRCGRFLQSMNVTYDPKPHQYRTTQSGNMVYSTVMEYSLQLQRNGNFSPTAGDPSSFLAD